MLDQFFTPENKAKELIGVVDKFCNIKSFDNVIEPSAGSGSFWRNLPNAIGLDLDPKIDGIIKTDFFDYKFPNGNNIVIGNPPYGKRGAMALKFINRCAENANIVAFILPRGFMRASLQNRVNQNMHLIHQEMVDDFELPDGTPHPVKSVFQIWKKKNTNRELIVEPSSHPDFELLHKHLSWTSEKELKKIRKDYPYVIGQNKMRIQLSKDVSKGSMWFIKPKVENVYETFKNATYETAFWTTGAPSLSKGDIINGYIKASSKNTNTENDR